MNELETKNILGILKFAYPSSYRDMKTADANATITLWHEFFRDDPFDEVILAVKSLICTRKEGYTVSIGEVKEQMAKNKEQINLTEQEAWTYVANACRNGLYGFSDEFYKLPEIIQQVIGRPEQLREWAMTDSDSFQSVIASNFMRSFREKLKHKKEILKLPSDVRKAITGIADSLALLE